MTPSMIDLATAVEQADIEGLWCRAYLKAPAENPVRQDFTTRVLWFQGKRYYADLRVPDELASGAHAGTALSDLSGAELRRLGACEGFGGISTVRDSVCTWQRVINLQGPETARDIGRLQMSGDGMYEYGVEADFVELWKQSGDHRSVHAEVLSDDRGRLAVFVRSSTAFLFACDRPERGAASARFAEQLDVVLAAPRVDRKRLERLLDAEYSFGRIENGAAIIELSTLPTRVGDCLMDDAFPKDDSLTTIHRSFAGDSFRRGWLPVTESMLPPVG